MERRPGEEDPRLQAAREFNARNRELREQEALAARQVPERGLDTQQISGRGRDKDSSPAQESVVFEFGEDDPDTLNAVVGDMIKKATAMEQASDLTSNPEIRNESIGNAIQQLEKAGKLLEGFIGKYTLDNSSDAHFDFEGQLESVNKKIEELREKSNKNFRIIS